MSAPHARSSMPHRSQSPRFAPQTPGAGAFGRMSPVSAFCLAGLFGAAVMYMFCHIIFAASLGVQTLVVGSLAYGGLVAIFALSMRRTYPHARVGLSNMATLGRVVVVAVLFVAVLERVPPSLGLLSLAVVSLLLDGVDGWLARREGLVSTFGARFDVEIDALFALLLSVYAVMSGVTQPYVLLLGVPHYLFWAARQVIPWLNQPLPSRLSRKTVCVLQITALIVMLVPGMSGPWLDALVAGAAAALTWSFGRDILWLHRTRA
ncbi:MAG: CDP-alcohol phosphatidyltransferase family protein [Pseudomonadota bacterium]